MAFYMSILPAIFTCFFFISLTSQYQQSNNYNLSICELHDQAQDLSFGICSLGKNNVNLRTLYPKEREKILEDKENKITYMQSALSSLKDDLLLADERLKALEEEMAEVLEQWVQIQHLEQALQIAEMRALQAQRKRDMRCTFSKFISHLSGRYLPKTFGSYSLGKGSSIKCCMSQALQQLRRLYSATKRHLHELHGVIILAIQRI